MSDFRFQPWPGTIAITAFLAFCSWLVSIYNKELYDSCALSNFTKENKNEYYDNRLEK